MCWCLRMQIARCRWNRKIVNTREIAGVEKAQLRVFGMGVHAVWTSASYGYVWFFVLCFFGGRGKGGLTFVQACGVISNFGRDESAAGSGEWVSIILYRKGIFIGAGLDSSQWPSICISTYTTSNCYPAKSLAYIRLSASRRSRICYKKSRKKSAILYRASYKKPLRTIKVEWRALGGEGFYILFLPLDKAAIKNIYLLPFIPIPSLLPIPLLLIFLPVLHPALSILTSSISLAQVLQRRARAPLLTERAMKNNDILLREILRHLREVMVKRGGWDIDGGMDVAADVIVVADVDDCDGWRWGGVEEDGGEAFARDSLEGCGCVSGHIVVMIVVCGGGGGGGGLWDSIIWFVAWYGWWRLDYIYRW